MREGPSARRWRSGGLQLYGSDARGTSAPAVNAALRHHKRRRLLFPGGQTADRIPERAGLTSHAWPIARNEESNSVAHGYTLIERPNVGGEHGLRTFKYR